PSEATQPIPCQPGTYGPLPGQDEATACTPCPAGRACMRAGLTQPDAECTPGGRPPTLCPVGHYCPWGTKQPTQFQCPPGTWSNQTGLTASEECAPCPGGWGTTRLSPGGRLAVACVLCPAGHHCPELGTTTPQPCSPGSFSGPGHLWCQDCPGGKLCNQTKLASPAACPPGHYCPARGLLSIPCPQGTFREAPGAARVEDCQPCRPGAFCGRAGLVEPQGLCRPGHHCGPGSNTSSPEGLPFGDLCPPGHFCPAGTENPRQRPCPVGTWNTERGAPDVSWCLPCPPGLFCAEVGQAAPRGPCASGWFCVSAAWTARPFDLDNYTSTNCLCPATATGGRCPAGSFCPEGSPEATPCPPGSFCATSEDGLTGAPCPPGTFCQRAGPCPPGHYCPRGSAMPQPCPPGTFSPHSKLSSEFPCPRGTYRPQRRGTQWSDCSPCEPGSYCPLPGLAAASGPCSAGFYCTKGASVPNPSDGTTGDLCPLGHFCPQGSPRPTPCPPGGEQSEDQPWGGLREGMEDAPVLVSLPEASGGHSVEPAGSLLPITGATSWKDCQPCPAGWLCSRAGLSSPDTPCEGGWFCPGSSVSGHSPGKLGKGVLWGAQGQPGGETRPVGSPSRTRTEEPLLLKFREASGTAAGAAATEQVWLQAWHLNHRAGKRFPDGPCSAGYYCPPGQTSATPSSFRCPPGFSCPEGSPQPRACENGTFQPREAQGSCEPCPAGFYCQASGTGTFGPRQGATAELDCELCPAGMFCSSEGLSRPSGLCHPTHYCSGGAVSPTPIQHKVPDGARPRDGLWPTCSTCVCRNHHCVGLFCRAGQWRGCWRVGVQTHLSGNDICPPGFFCPRGTGFPVPCSPGFYSAAPGLASEQQCQPCPPGHYCSRPGLSHILDAGVCDAGYICLGGSVIPSPSDGTHGYRCPPGFRCPAGAHSELPCEPGTFSPLPGADTCLPCPGGTYCQKAATVEPVTCPKGNKCPQAHLWGQRDVGHDPRPCSAGYYCEGGASSSTPWRNSAFPLNGPCPRGHYCPQGTLHPVPCPVGKTRSSPGTWSPPPCPPGTFTPKDMPGLREEGDCSVCPPGHYCRFAHQFVDPGTYVFQDNGLPESLAVVLVKEQGVACDPGLPPVQPSSPYQLARHGVLRHQPPNLGPDWVAISGKPLAAHTLEDFSVRTLYDKLEDQSLHVAAQLSRHRSDALAFYRGASLQLRGLQ
ncbi:hypothetical protein M91_11522, partial [Bos mutus]